jgi:hypothetical protein
MIVVRAVEHSFNPLPAFLGGRIQRENIAILTRSTVNGRTIKISLSQMMLASKRKQPQIPMPLADLRSAPGHGNAVLLGSVAPVPSSGALRGRPSNGQNDLHERARIGVTHSKFSTKFFGTRHSNRVLSFAIRRCPHRS